MGCLSLRPLQLLRMSGTSGAVGSDVSVPTRDFPGQRWQRLGSTGVVWRMKRRKSAGQFTFYQGRCDTIDGHHVTSTGNV